MSNIKIKKLGLIPFPKEQISWAAHTLLQPTPILLDEDTIRVYCGMRDNDGKSRAGYVDLDARNPLKILDVSRKPVLDIGQHGMFDESGVVPCAVTKDKNGFRLYYAGYQLGQHIRFYVFSGLAESQDGKTFERVKRVPVLERSDKEPLFRVVHSILSTDNGWQAWYGAGDEFRSGETKTLPVYNVRYMRSDNGVDFPTHGQTVLDIAPEEHRIGRPYVLKNGSGYIMFYGYGTEKDPYKLGIAVSDDGLSWQRQDDKMLFDEKDNDWETEMKAYPSVIKTVHGNYFFYNGNAYGRDGFGCCLIEGLID